MIAKSTSSFLSAATFAYDCASVLMPVLCSIAFARPCTYARRACAVPNSTDGAKMPTVIFAGCATATAASTHNARRILVAIDPLLRVDPLLQIARVDALALRALPRVVGFLGLAHLIVNDADVD